jgi:hypothetical protein
MSAQAPDDYYAESIWSNGKGAWTLAFRSPFVISHLQKRPLHARSATD